MDFFTRQNKKLKTYTEKVSKLILKEKLRLNQLAGINTAEIVPFTNAEIVTLWAESEHWQRACSNSLGEISNKHPKSKRLQFIKLTNWLVPQIIKEKPISEAPKFYTDANKSGKAGGKSEHLSKVAQSPYELV